MSPAPIALGAVALVLALTAGCTSRTEYGECIGAFDDPDPALRYRTEGWNIAMDVIFIEMIVPLIVVIANETRCPIGRKPDAGGAP